MGRAWYLSTPLIVTALALDAALGDPRWIVHPVVLLGRVIGAGETLLRTRDPRRDLRRGAMLAGSVVAMAALAAWLIIGICNSLVPALGAIAAVLLAWTALAARGLNDAALEVERHLDAGEYTDARRAIPALAGRDPESLDRDGLARAAVESIAENTSDGVVAPMFYLFLAGAAGAIAYKAINTLDSMIGYRDERYWYFGRAAARIDDVANFIPSRLTALCISCAAAMVSSRAPQAFAAWRADGWKHASPNAGGPEAAMAGALGVELGGDAVYGGEIEHRAVLGRPGRAPEVGDITTARKMLWVTAAIAFVAMAAVRWALGVE